jgi:esterase
VVADISPVAYIAKQDTALNALQAISGLHIDSVEQAENIMLLHGLGAEFRALLLKHLVREDSGAYILKINMTSISENYASTLDAAPIGYPYSGPTLFLKGETSAYIQRKHHPKIAELFPNMKMMVMKGVGHWLHAENSIEFNQRVADFLA